MQEYHRQNTEKISFFILTIRCFICQAIYNETRWKQMMMVWWVHVKSIRGNKKCRYEYHSGKRPSEVKISRESKNMYHIKST